SAGAEGDQQIVIRSRGGIGSAETNWFISLKTMLAADHLLQKAVRGSANDHVRRSVDGSFCYGHGSSVHHHRSPHLHELSWTCRSIPPEGRASARPYLRGFENSGGYFTTAIRQQSSFRERVSANCFRSDGGTWPPAIFSTFSCSIHSSLTPSR